MKSIVDFLDSRNIAYEENVSGKRLCSFHVGGDVRAVVRPKDASELQAVFDFAEENCIEAVLLGKGSNIVISDKGFDGIVILLSEFNSIDIENGRIRAGAGVSMLSLASFAQKNGLSGLEFAHGIPGSVGGGVYMNAGAYGGEICQLLVECECLDKRSGEVIHLTNAECGFSYRKSIFQENKDLVILSASFELTSGSCEEIKEKMDNLRAQRMEKQPLEYPSAGSTFKRPPNAFAGKLIEDSGLKGYRIGGACVSEKHAGFVVNTGDATCADIVAVVEHVKHVVYEKYGVMLECEVEFLASATESMSLSERVKLEFMQDFPHKTCCRRALAYGMLFDASVDGENVFFDVANGLHSRYCARILERQFSKPVTVSTVTKAGRAHFRISINIPSMAKKLSANGKRVGSIGDYMEFKCNLCRMNFIRGVFLTRGTLTFNAGNSHLEFRILHRDRANAFSAFLAACAAEPKTIERKNAVGIYYKRASSIENIMILLKANNSYFEIMNAQIERNIKADENRAVNCESVNIMKSVMTAQKHLKAIEIIKDAGLLDKIGKVLTESAELRLEHHSASLSELAALHEPPITKSILNKRFAKIMQMAENIANKK